MSFVFASSSLPGLPVWQTQPEVIQEVLWWSLDFFYINTPFTALGLSPIPAVAVGLVMRLRRPCKLVRHGVGLLYLGRVLA